MKIIAPLFVRIDKNKTGKKYIINLNQYRNWHFHVNNKIKKEYLEQIKNQIIGKKLLTPIKLEFKLFKGRKVKIDRANVLSIHEKFLCDALVNCNCIEDDSDEFIEETKYLSSEYDKERPRVEITILQRNNK